jgi:sigma-B regulation protein RsbU (phosphoserine phosphatase)
MDCRSPKWRVKRIVTIGVTAIIANAGGAMLTFFYFAVVETPLTSDIPSADFADRFHFFLGMLSLVLLMTVAAAARLFYPIVRDLYRGPESLSPAGKQKLAGRMMNIPLYTSGVSFFGWVLSAVVFPFIPCALEMFYNGNLYHAWRTFFGILFVGLPFTTAFVWLTSEWSTRRALRELFGEPGLTEIPPSVKINVLPKMVLVTLIIGTIPVSGVSYITLDNIRHIQAGKLELTVFLSQMPLVIGFLLMVAIVFAVLLSVFLSKSVSIPLMEAGEAMEKLKDGDLTARVPVVSNDEIGRMAEGFNSMAEGLEERDVIRDAFGRYVSDEVVTEILKSPNGLDLEGDLRDISILVADLRGFTTMTESLGPRQILKILNMFLGSMTDIVMRHEGTIDEFTGDGLLVFFGAPRPMADHASAAVVCALDMQAAMAGLNERLRQDRLPALGMGIGINCGELVVGNLGSEQRKKYGAVGSPINVAFRVEARTEAGEILITRAVFERIGTVAAAEPKETVSLKGIEAPVQLYRVTDTTTLTSPGSQAENLPRAVPHKPAAV